jgi:hypothetical protein
MKGAGSRKTCAFNLTKNAALHLMVRPDFLLENNTFDEAFKDIKP